MKSLSLPGASSQIILSPNAHQQFWQADCTVQFYTQQYYCSRKTEHTYITYAHSPPHTLYSTFFFFFSTFPSPLSSLISFFFFLFFFWIGLIPCSLACPIIFWNIQGNVSSCCHSNYSNIQHGSWLSSFWKCFSFLSRSSVTREGCRLFKGICSKLAQKRDNTAKGERGETQSKLEWST